MESTASDRRSVRMQSVVATGFGLVVFIVFYFITPLSVPRMPTTIAKLAYTLQWQTVSALTLIAGITTVALTRLHTTAIDPINGGGDYHVMVHSRYVQNTGEQLILSMTGQLILSTYLSEHQMGVIPILVFLFVVGRITFWAGYKTLYVYRAFGFALTWMSNLSLYVTLCYLFISGK